MSNSEQQFNQALQLMDQNKFAEAEPILRNVTRSEPRTAIVHYFLDACLFNMKRFADTETVMMLGRCLMRQEKYVEAEQCFKKGSQMDPNERQYYDEWIALTTLSPFRARWQEQLKKQK